MANIMIVDDNKDIVETLKTIMEKGGNNIGTARSGSEFLSKVEQFKPDLVLLDVMMPGLTTKQILEKLEETGLKEIRIILVTVVRFSDDEKDQLFKKYIKDYISKPFDLAELVTKVNKQITG